MANQNQNDRNNKNQQSHQNQQGGQRQQGGGSGSERDMEKNREQRDNKR